MDIINIINIDISNNTEINPPNLVNIFGKIYDVMCPLCDDNMEKIVYGLMNRLLDNETQMKHSCAILCWLYTNSPEKLVAYIIYYICKANEKCSSYYNMFVIKLLYLLFKTLTYGHTHYVKLAGYFASLPINKLQELEPSQLDKTIRNMIIADCMINNIAGISSRVLNTKLIAVQGSIIGELANDEQVLEFCCEFIDNYPSMINKCLIHKKTRTGSFEYSYELLVKLVKAYNTCVDKCEYNYIFDLYSGKQMSDSDINDLLL
jgi:hypothetical protein